jgi:hypothetical protein
MDISFDIPDIARFERAAAIAPQVFAKNMRLGMKRSTASVRDLARRRHRFRTRTGNLVKAITAEVTMDGTDGVMGRDYIDPDRAFYGKWVHDGTKPHIIRARNKKVLRWATGRGKWRFARWVRHPGTKPDQFLYEAGRLQQNKINEIFAEYTNKAIQEAGL